MLGLGRRLASGVVGCAALAMGGCTAVDTYRGLDGAPGDYVSGSSQFQRVMSDINPMSDYNSQWVLVRVVAPAGATRCWVADKSPFDPTGPRHEGRPDAKREVLLTHKAYSDTATFACKTPAGEVKRSVKAVPYEMKYRDKVIHTTPLKPPLVHLDPSDAEAGSRWTAIAAELCPQISDRASKMICKTGMMDKLRAADIGS